MVAAAVVALRSWAVVVESGGAVEVRATFVGSRRARAPCACAVRRLNTRPHVARLSFAPAPRLRRQRPQAPRQRPPPAPDVGPLPVHPGPLRYPALHSHSTLHPAYAAMLTRLLVRPPRPLSQPLHTMAKPTVAKSLHGTVKVRSTAAARRTSAELTHSSAMETRSPSSGSACTRWATGRRTTRASLRCRRGTGTSTRPSGELSPLPFLPPNFCWGDDGLTSGTRTRRRWAVPCATL